MDTPEQVIRKVSRRYCIHGHPRLDLEDMIQEGWLVYSQLRQQNEPDTEEFLRTLFVSCKNHAISLRRKEIDKTIVTISLSISSGIDERVDPGRLQMIHLQAKLRQARELLSPAAFQVFQLLVSPPLEAIRDAVADYLRARHLGSRHRSLKITDRQLLRYFRPEYCGENWRRGAAYGKFQAARQEVRQFLSQ